MDRDNFIITICCLVHLHCNRISLLKHNTDPSSKIELIIYDLFHLP